MLLYDKTDNLTSFNYISCKVVCMQTTHSDTALYALTQEIKFTQHILFIFASDFVRSYAYLYQEDKPCPRGVYTGISPARQTISLPAGIAATSCFLSGILNSF